MFTCTRWVGKCVFACAVVVGLAVPGVLAQPVGAQQAWSQIPTGSADVIKNAPDSNKLLAVDSVGNAYVASQVDGAIKLWKYSAIGNPLWTASVPFITETASYYPTAVALRESGFVPYVVVVGTVPGPDGQDFVTIKYNASDGAIQWWTTYNNSPQDSDDIAVDVAIDEANDFIFVTGSSVGTNTGSDYATVKYNSNGVQQWVRRYEYPKADVPSGIVLAQSASGVLVVVTGSSWNGTNDYATIAYKFNGDFAWSMYSATQYAARFDRGGVDNATGVTAFEDLIFVTGSSVASNGSQEYATFCYAPNDGSVVWGPVFYSAPGIVDKAVPRRIVGAHAPQSLLAPKAIYVTGESWGGATGYDYATLQYNAFTGLQAWASRFNLDSVNGEDRGVDLYVPESADVYVTGLSFNGSTLDYRTVRHDYIDGTKKWSNPTHSIAYDGGLVDTASAIRLAPTVNLNYTPDLWVLGRSTTATGVRPVLVKYCQCSTPPCSGCP